MGIWFRGWWTCNSIWNTRIKLWCEKRIWNKCKLAQNNEINSRWIDEKLIKLNKRDRDTKIVKEGETWIIEENKKLK